MQDFTSINPTLLSLKLGSKSDSFKISSKLSNILRPGDILALWGDLGVGKSTLARSMIQTLCGSETDVPSPTFTLVQIYDAPDFEVWHMDLYRLNSPEDIFELGIEDAFHKAVSLVEWPDKMGGYLPLARLDVIMEFNVDDKSRSLTLQGDESWAARLKDINDD